jgi:hypothetical protein
MGSKGSKGGSKGSKGGSKGSKGGSKGSKGGSKGSKGSGGSKGGMVRVRTFVLLFQACRCTGNRSTAGDWVIYIYTPLSHIHRFRHGEIDFR